jgi:hypothetical protein
MPQQPASSSTTSAPGMRSQQRDRRRGARQRLLVAVAVEEDPRRCRRRRSAARRRRSPRPAAPRPAACARRLRRGRRQQLHVLLAQRQQARRPRRRCPRRPGQPLVSASALARGVVEPGPLLMSTRARSSRRSRAARRSPLRRAARSRAPDARLGEGGERVREEDHPRPRPASRGRLPVPVRPSDQVSLGRAREVAGGDRFPRPSPSSDAERAGSTAAPVALPMRFSVRIEPNSRERSGVPWIALWCERNSDFSVAMSTDSGHSLLHALHSRQRSRISRRRSSPSAAPGSGLRECLHERVGAPAVACSSSRVAM